MLKRLSEQNSSEYFDKVRKFRNWCVNTKNVCFTRTEIFKLHEQF